MNLDEFTNFLVKDCLVFFVSEEIRTCQGIGLVTIMFFFKLLFSYVSSQFPSMFSFANLFSIVCSFT